MAQGQRANGLGGVPRGSAALVRAKRRICLGAESVYDGSTMLLGALVIMLHSLVACALCRRAPLVCKPLNRACHTRRFVATIACGVSTTGPGRPSHQVTQGETSARCEMQILPVKRALDGYRLTARSSARARHHTPSSRTRLTTRHIHIDCRARLAPTSRPSCWPSCPVGVAKPLRSHCPRLTLPAARFTVSSHTVIPSRSLFPIPHAVIPHSERRRRGGVGEGVRGTGNHARS